MHLNSLLILTPIIARFHEAGGIAGINGRRRLEDRIECRTEGWTDGRVFVFCGESFTASEVFSISAGWSMPLFAGMSGDDRIDDCNAARGIVSDVDTVTSWDFPSVSWFNMDWICSFLDDSRIFVSGFVSTKATLYLLSQFGAASHSPSLEITLATPLPSLPVGVLKVELGDASTEAVRVACKKFDPAV